MNEWVESLLRLGGGERMRMDEFECLEMMKGERRGGAVEKSDVMDDVDGFLITTAADQKLWTFEDRKTKDSQDAHHTRQSTQ